MGLAATWRRQGTWAAAATFLVPGALFLALLGGGLGALRALGQVVTGPQVPEARLAASTVPTRPHAARLPTVPALRPAQGILAPGPSAAGAPAAGNGATPVQPVAAAPPRRTVPRPAAGRPATVPAQQPPPAAKPGSPVRQVGEQVAAGVGQVPVVGPAGQQAVTGVLDTVAPPPQPGAVLRALAHH